ncbi:MAG: hypothetical protein KF784_07195 [Fimbriimonadaceae bacterium]|nr:hypothetical protein [Fimbriimonadaceae bacterium]
MRLSSTGVQALQIRWKLQKGAFDGEALIDGYFSKLKSDAKRFKVPFRREHKEVGEFEHEYRWVGQGQGRGVLFLEPISNRVFFLEVTGDRSASLLSQVRAARSSFQTAADSRELWSVFGLQALIPSGLALDSKRFESGRTRLMFKHRLTKVEVERWAMGSQLVAKHGLESWAKSNLGWESAETVEEDGGLRLVGKARLGQRREAIVQLQPEPNQICIVKSSFRDAQWRPEWDWLPDFEES